MSVSESHLYSTSEGDPVSGGGPSCTAILTTVSCDRCRICGSEQHCAEPNPCPLVSCDCNATALSSRANRGMTTDELRYTRPDDPPHPLQNLLLRSRVRNANPLRRVKRRAGNDRNVALLEQASRERRAGLGFIARRIADSNVEIKGTGWLDHRQLRSAEQRQRGITTTAELGHHRSHGQRGVVRTRQCRERGVLRDRRRVRCRV